MQEHTLGTSQTGAQGEARSPSCWRGLFGWLSVLKEQSNESEFLQQGVCCLDAPSLPRPLSQPLPDMALAYHLLQGGIGLVSLHIEGNSRRERKGEWRGEKVS